MESGDEHRIAIDAKRSGFAAEALQPIFDLNESALRALIAGARALATPPPPDSLASDLLALSEDRILQIAKIPVALTDAGFQHVERWDALATGAAKSHDLPRSITDHLFTRADLERLSTLTFVSAWDLARFDPAGARIVFGMHPEVASSIARLSLPTVEELCRGRAYWIRLRWGAAPQVWRHLIRTAEAGNSSRLPPLAVRALMHQFADMEAATSAANTTAHSCR